MPVDNQLYDRLGDTWWDDDALLGLLRTSVNPGRFGYMRRILTEELRIDPHGKTTLDVGCGGAMLRDMRRRARGEMSYAEFGHRHPMREQRDRSGLFAGYAIKR